MPDSKKITIKTKVTINTISDGVDARDNAARVLQDETPSIVSDENELRRQPSSRRQSRRKKNSNDSNVNVESIVLQESNRESRPVQLKASFLRRKMQEYEGKKIENEK